MSVYSISVHRKLVQAQYNQHLSVCFIWNANSIYTVQPEDVMTKLAEHRMPYLFSFLSSSTNQPDRIRQFGLCGRKDPRVLELSPSGGRETPSRISLPNHEKLAFRDREMPPPEQPHVAFQSPLLGYSSSLGGGGLSPSSQPAAPAFPRAVDTPRYPFNMKPYTGPG